MSVSSDTLFTAAIIPAAGSGTRMGNALPKQLLELRGEPILLHTVRKFLELPEIHTVIVVLPAILRRKIEQLLLCRLPEALHNKLCFATGGSTRQDSVLAGLTVLPEETALVLVHDGARPLIDPDIIRACLLDAAQFGATIAAVEVKDTLKLVDDTATIAKTIDRTSLWHAQTPQAARRKLLDAAFAKAQEEGFKGTDEASLLEHAGIPVHITRSSEQNLKITRPDDLKLANGLLQEKAVMKIGHGFDAHQLTQGRRLILGGVHIPYERGLLGHSDADVLTHALIDAILGALGKGDIGGHFPDSNSDYKDINSLSLLAQVIQLAGKERMQIGNADITVICQQPKLAPFLAEMKKNLADACLVDRNTINIKATTTEKMGYAGRGEGISAHAVVLLSRS